MQMLEKTTTTPRKRVGTRTPRTALNPRDKQIVDAILEAEKYDFIDHELLHKRNAEKLIFDDAPEIGTPDTSWYHPVMDNLSEIKIQKSEGQVILTGAEEAVIFTQFNYCRFVVSNLRTELLAAKRFSSVKAAKMLKWHRKAEFYRDKISNINLALVLAMAKRTRMSEVDFADLVSEGNMALLRAVDKFDVSRGFKFSTYACRAILKAFSRTGVKLSKYRQLFPAEFDPKLERSDFMDRKRVGHKDDCVDEIRTIMRSNRAELTDIEQEVIEHRFGLGKARTVEDTKPLTLEQVGKIIGVTKERVRQIQNKALVKIKESLEGDFLN